MRHGEVNGKEYFFVTREKMEEEIEAGKFIEFGEYKGNLYGTSAESVKSLVNAGYVCILNPHYQVSSLFTIDFYIVPSVISIGTIFCPVFLGLENAEDSSTQTIHNIHQATTI
jgi:guanylate kinase